MEKKKKKKFDFKGALTSTSLRDKGQEPELAAADPHPESPGRGTTIGSDTRKPEVLVSRRYSDSGEPPATLSTHNYDGIFPQLAVTPGLQASCPTSPC